ncbi:FG-GAP-like repeat-containing protein [Ekhidna sp.]|jgi:hypothetical protein|uniref:FG-GAP-like repeat-containing protein n=1 Tax=Ekhidna sp. TaxID=2608089 RepID=UPI0032ED0727
MTRLFITILAIHLSVFAQGQFVLDESIELANNLIPTSFGVADYNNDGNVDLAVGGSNGRIFQGVYRNEGGSLALDVGLSGIENGSIDWGDFDGDGFVDIVLTGVTVEGSGMDQVNYPITHIFKNDNGTFTYYETDIVGIQGGNAEWGDFDSDGDLDLALIGSYATGENDTLLILQNNNGNFIALDVPLQPISGNLHGTLSWGDYDNDNDLDLLVSGIGSFEGSYFRSVILKNNNGVFEDSGIEIQGKVDSNVAWLDYDGDGLLDFIQTGEGDLYDHTINLSKNLGNETFESQSSTLLPLANTSLDVQDFDRDGDPDLVITGIGVDDGIFKTKIYQNSGGVFVDMEEMIEGVWGPAHFWDYDGDTDFDLIIGGIDNTYNDFVAVYENTYDIHQIIDFPEIEDKTYGDASFPLGVAVSSGLDLDLDISGPVSVNDDIVSITGVGEVSIVASQAGEGDYLEAIPVERTFSVKKANLEVTADDKQISENEEMPDFTVSYSGFVYDEDASVLTAEPIAAVEAADASTPGTYEISVSGGIADNYTFSFNNGILTIQEVLSVVEDNIKIYPNPATSEIQISSANAVSLEVIDLNGNRLKHLPVNSRIDISNLPNGTYLLRITDKKENTLSVQKLIKH